MNAALTLAAEHDLAGRHDDAINALARASQTGDLDAMTELGKRLVIGDKGPLLPMDGAGLLLDAAKAGHAEAALRLATMTALGAHVQQSWSDALGLLVVRGRARLGVGARPAAGAGWPGGRSERRRSAMAPPRASASTCASGSARRPGKRCARPRSCACSEFRHRLGLRLADRAGTAELAARVDLRPRRRQGHCRPHAHQQRRGLRPHARRPRASRRAMAHERGRRRAGRAHGRTHGAALRRRRADHQSLRLREPAHSRTTRPRSRSAANASSRSSSI